MKQIEIILAKDKKVLDRCLKVRELVFTVEKGISKKIEVDSYDTINRESNHFLIQYQNEDVGAVRCLLLPDNSIKVQRFCVLKSYRNLGIGKETLQYIESYYKECGNEKMELDSKYSVHKFYEKCGYIRSSEVFMEAGVEHVKMIKIIANKK